MKVLYVSGKGYYVAGTDTLWSSWTSNIEEATMYEDLDAITTAYIRKNITGDLFQVKKVPKNIRRSM